MKGAGSDAYRGWASAWNAIPYRMLAANHYQTQLSVSLTKSRAPDPVERYHQEHALFAFSFCSLSALECYFFAAFCLGNLLLPNHFPMQDSRDLRFYPEDVARRFKRCFSGTAQVSAMGAVLAASEFRIVSDLRNALSHRVSPPRCHSLVGGDSAGRTTIPRNLRDLPQNWTHTIALEAATFNALGAWLTDSLDQLIVTLRDLLDGHLLQQGVGAP